LDVFDVFLQGFRPSILTEAGIELGVFQGGLFNELSVTGVDLSAILKLLQVHRLLPDLVAGTFDVDA